MSFKRNIFSGHGDKEQKNDKSSFSSFTVQSPPNNGKNLITMKYEQNSKNNVCFSGGASQERPKKKSGFFKKLWKRSKHNSCE